MPDSNDILYEGYQIDFFYVGSVLFDIFGFDGITYESFASLMGTIWDTFVILSFIVTGILIVAMIYAYIRMLQMAALEMEWIYTQERLYKELYGKGTESDRWQDIESHIATENPNDWKLAIIEADVMLEEVLENAGYAGLTIGEKLKSASPTQFKTLDDAWKAHKVRNDIAHGGADFVLTKKLANETITQYRRVFQEFGAI